MTSKSLKIARTRLNWPQVRLAKELGLTVFTISRYERGDKPPKTVDLAIRYLLIREKRTKI